MAAMATWRVEEFMARIYVDMCVCVFVQFKENYIDDLDEVNESR